MIFLLLYLLIHFVCTNYFAYSLIINTLVSNLLLFRLNLTTYSLILSLLVQKLLWSNQSWFTSILKISFWNYSLIYFSLFRNLILAILVLILRINALFKQGKSLMYWLFTFLFIRWSLIYWRKHTLLRLSIKIGCKLKI